MGKPISSWTGLSGLRKHTPEQVKKVMERLAEVKKGPPSAVLLIAPGHSENYIREARKNPPPKTWKRLYQQRLSVLSLPEIQSEALNIIPSLTRTKQEIHEIEQLSKLQRDSRAWRDYRLGLVTASIFYRVLHTRIEKPAISLLMEICYPKEPFSKKKNIQRLAQKVDDGPVAALRYKFYPFKRHTILMNE